MKICPFTPLYFHNHFMEPYLQGCEMVTRAWKGIDFHSLTKAPLSLKERVISWIVGTLLLIPIINTIIWFAWKMLGNPTIYFDPYSPEPEPLEVVSGRVAQPIAEVQIPNMRPDRVDRFEFIEKVTNQELRVKWQIEHYPTLTQIHHHSDVHAATSIYDLDNRVREFHLRNLSGSMDVLSIDATHIKAKIQEHGKEPIEKILTLEEDLPWIQQPTIGFKEFILSDETELLFYGVLPENPARKVNIFAEVGPTLMKARIKKIKEENVPPFGKLLKAEIVSEWGFPYNLLKGEVWYDRETGALRKFKDPGIIRAKVGEFVQNPPH